MIRTLVAGGVGFIGTHLCKRLLGEGRYAICLDNLYTGSIANIKSLLSHDSFEFLQSDVIKPVTIKADEIYNPACFASPRHYIEDPVFTIKTSFLGALNLLEYSQKNNCKILQASTSEIYGDPDIHPQSENYWGNVNPIGIRSCYDEGKRAAESLFFDFNRKYGVRIKVVRIFNTYGPFMQPDDGRVISNFILQALKGQDITIYGSGDQTRCFCYIDDLVEGMIRLMRSKDDFTGPVNIGNPHELTILELAKIIIQLTGSKSKLVFENLPQDDPKRRKPDISLANRELSWSPAVGLEEGLLKTIDHFKRGTND